MAEDVFREAIIQLRNIGAFNFLFPFLLTMAIFYGLLRKSKIFGPPETNIAVNAIVSLVAAFMVWSYPVINGVDIEGKLSAFFAQGIVVTLVLMMGMLGAGMILPPDFKWDKLFEGNKAAAVLIITFIGGLVIVVTSGLVGLIISPDQITSIIPTQALVTLGVLVIALLPVMWLFGSGKTNGAPAPQRPGG